MGPPIRHRGRPRRLTQWPTAESYPFLPLEEPKDMNYQFLTSCNESQKTPLYTNESLGRPSSEDLWANPEGDSLLPQHPGILFQPELPIGIPPFPGFGWPDQAEFKQSARPGSTISSSTRASSLESTSLSLSPVQTEISDTKTVRSRYPSPLRRTLSDPPNPHTCVWAGCDRPSFATHAELVWHVQAEHLLVCPAAGCGDKDFASTRLLKVHLAVSHPEQGGEVKEWQLQPQAGKQPTQTLPVKSNPEKAAQVLPSQKPDAMTEGLLNVDRSKRKYKDELRNVVEKKARKRLSSHPSPPASSPTDIVRNRASNLIDTASFPLVFEHAILPFLAEFMPKWSGPGHVISVTRGRTRDSRRICIMTETPMSFPRKVIVARHVKDLLPDTHRPNISFVFATGKVSRMTWARGLSAAQPDEVCIARNPYCFRLPCMGDSVGIPGSDSDSYVESTATLGPCLNVDGGSYWLCNFHPFVDAWTSTGRVMVEHPSPQDRARCIDEGHDAISPDGDFQLGKLVVSSGLSLETTRVSHDPYWEECGKDQPLIVTDWALVSSSVNQANILRRFPTNNQSTVKEALVKSTSHIAPGAMVIASGRTSGYQRGQVCEIPAYLSAEQNGTPRATREWFIEEPYPYNDEESWIRGGIGVEGDSGSAVIDAETHSLVGQVWARNVCFGGGPRHTYFTPISDIFDDIQEKCGQQTRAQLPQHRDEADRYPMLPTCRQCYDLRSYLDSRRSSRMSLQSMVMCGDTDHDLTSIEAISELATPRDSCRGIGIEEAGASFNNVFSPGQLAALGELSDARSPYAQTLEIDKTDDEPVAPFATLKRPATPEFKPITWTSEAKRHKTSSS